MFYVKKGFSCQVNYPFTSFFPGPVPGQSGIAVQLDDGLIGQLDCHALSVSRGVRIVWTVYPLDQKIKSNQQNYCSCHSPQTTQLKLFHQNSFGGESVFVNLLFQLILDLLVRQLILIKMHLNSGQNILCFFGLYVVPNLILPKSFPSDGFFFRKNDPISKILVLQEVHHFSFLKWVGMGWFFTHSRCFDPSLLMLCLYIIFEFEFIFTSYKYFF